MRHRCNVPKLSMRSDRRRAVVSGQARDLILYGKVDTTLARAKATQALAERLVTWARTGEQAAQRRAFAILQSKEATEKLFSELGPQYRDREGGYTRVLKLGPRRGDGAEVAPSPGPSARPIGGSPGSDGRRPLLARRTGGAIPVHLRPTPSPPHG